MSKVDKLRSKFKTNKRVLEELISKALNESYDSQDAKEEIAAQLEVIRRRKTLVMSTSEEIQALLTNEEELLDYAMDVANFEIYCERSISTLLKRIEGPKEEVRSHSKPEEKARTVKLPRLVIEKFDGDYKKWQTFYDSFVAAVDSQPSLSKVEKFNYLRGYLYGEAMCVIEGFQLTNENYDKAMELLRERFGNKQAIITAHMNELLMLQRVDNENDIYGIRQLYDKIGTHVRSLESLGIKGENYGTLLVPILLDKLPTEFKRHLTRATKDGECWDFMKLLDLINDEIKVMEASTATGNINSFSKFDPPATGATLFAGSKQKGFKDKPKISCVFCKQTHWSDKCSVITDRKARKEFLLKNGFCFVCLKKDHKASECKKSKLCYYCNGLHNSCICTREQPAKSHVNMSQLNSHNTNDVTIESFQNGNLPQSDCSKTNVTQSDSSTKVNVTHGDVLLQTADLILKNKHSKKEMKVKALFDSASQRTYISDKASKFLKCPIKNTEFIDITTFGSKGSIPSNRDLVIITAIGLDHKEYEFHALTFPTLCSSLPRNSVQTAQLGFDSITFADKGEVEGDVDLLVGADLLWYFFTGNIVRSKTCHGLVAMETVFGWVLGGPSKANPQKTSPISTTQTNLVMSCSNEMDGLVKKFWDLETLGIRDEKPFEELYSESIVRDENKRYEVRLPFKENHPVISDNYELCKSRLLKLHDSLRKDPELLKKYDEIFQEQLEQGIIEPVTDPATVGCTSYLPHHAVIRDDKETTKVRVVFDASAKDKGPSLNDCLLKGPQLTPLLFDILIRFRSQIVAISADIEKAFHQIGVSSQDRDYLRFLWFDNIFSDQPTIIRNRFARVVFGITSSPFSLNATIRKHAESFDFDPEFVDTVLSSFFVDDFVGGEINEQRAFELFKKLQLRFTDGHFWLRKWRTNNENVRNLINANLETSHNEKILGIVWDDLHDKFVFDLNEIYNEAKELPPTKRNILKIVASFYDPLGLLQPIISTMKTILQSIHKDNVQWDEELSGSLRGMWFNVLEQLRFIGKVEFDRCVEFDDVISRELHGFSDASKQGYGACIYIRSILKSGEVKVSLLTAKSRVAPLKEETIPRLELLGNLLLARIITSVKKAYHLPFDKTFLWTDSKVTLAWIRSDKEFKTFVQNRINEIRKITNSNDWFYCPTNENPADIITRLNLYDPRTSLWREGPNFLKETKIETNELHCLELDMLPDVKISTTVNANTTNNAPLSVLDFNRFNSFNRLLRTTAWVIRYVKNLKAKIRNETLNLSEVLSSSELQDAEKRLVKANQIEFNSYSPNEMNEKFKHLNVKADKDGIFRCYGRLRNAPMSFETINPILLDTKHALARLLVLHYHTTRKHVLVKQTLTELRTKYWICRGRNFIRNIINKCVTCRKIHGKPYRYPENPSLTVLRLSDARPYFATGVDNFGPVYLKTIYGRTSYKAWVTLYTCASSRAILLDLVPSIDSKCFIRSFNRFIARRGCPDHMISDNGKNFVSIETQTHIANCGIEWHLNLPLAPWHGGFFERLVRSVKELLRKELDKRKLNYEQLSTILFEIEFILNNRPLTYVYPNDLETCVTPNHLLFGRMLNAQSLNSSETSYDSYEKVDFHVVAEVIDSFWKRWLKEYIVNLREHHKYETRNHRQPSPQVSDVVLIHDEHQPRSMWRTGIVTEIIDSSDNQVRGVLVRSSTGSVLKRPVNKLIPIEYVRHDVSQVNEQNQHDDNTVLN